jgi:pimeloyl-ACP methyl ester carboxylesterase
MTTVAAEEKRITVNGVELRYFDYGNENATPLICLHGHTGQAHIWDEFAEEMSSRFHVLTIDQRGHGESGWASTGYERDRFVEDLGALIDALGFEKVVLSGLSMGGWNSLLYTTDHPERVEKIIIVDIGPESSEEARKQWGSRAPAPTEFDSLDGAIASARENNPWVADDRLRQDISDRFKQRQDGKWAAKADPALTAGPLRDGTDQDLIRRYWHALEVIPCPILEVRGAESPLLDGVLREKMQKAAKNLSWIDVPEAGHVVTVDQPKAFIEATRSFLST